MTEDSCLLSSCVLLAFAVKVKQIPPGGGRHLKALGIYMNSKQLLPGVPRLCLLLDKKPAPTRKYLELSKATHDMEGQMDMS